MTREWGVVIGAGPGLGRSMALVMAHHGLAVAPAGRDEERLRALADEVATVTGDPDAVSTLRLDVADPEAVHQSLWALADRVDLQCLADNAVSASGSLLGVTPTQVTAAIEVNALSAVAAVGATASSLERAGGSVLITGGGLALHPSSAAGVLSLGKAALRSVALLLAQDLAPRGVRVRTLTIAGTIGSSPSLSPDVIAEAFWAMRDGADVEQVYSG